MIEGEGWSLGRPYSAKIIHSSSVVKPGGDKIVMHIEVDLGDSEIIYQPGDSFGVWAENSPQDVDVLLHALGFKGEEIVKVRDKSYELREFLTKRANLSRVNQSLIELLSRKTEVLDAAEKTVVEIIQEHPGVALSLEEFIPTLSHIVPRYYSVASSMKEVGNRVHLLVELTEFVAGRPRLGFCSYYLIEGAKQSESVPIFLLSAPHFRLPEDPDKDIIMIGPGTGVAPFRAFMQERKKGTGKGRNWLFFGERYRTTHFFYEEFWADLESAGKLVVHTAFSRDFDEKIYVQHKLQEKAREVWEWVKGGAYIYVCGDKERMAKDVMRTFLEIFMREGGMSEAEAKGYLKELRKQKRYCQDVY